MTAILRAYHPTARLPEDEAQLQPLYCAVLNGQRALLLLNNAANAAQLLPLLPPGSCLLLVTSRQRFTLPGLRLLDLDALPRPEAETLLCEIAPRVGEHYLQGNEGILAGLSLYDREAHNIHAGFAMRRNFQIWRCQNLLPNPQILNQPNLLYASPVLYSYFGIHHS